MTVIFYQVSEIDGETFLAQKLSNTPNVFIQVIILSIFLIQISTGKFCTRSHCVKKSVYFLAFLFNCSDGVFTFPTLMVCFHCPTPIPTLTPIPIPMKLGLIKCAELFPLNLDRFVFLFQWLLYPFWHLHRYQLGGIYLLKEWELLYRPVVGITKQASS